MALEGKVKLEDERVDFNRVKGILDRIDPDSLMGKVSISYGALPHSTPVWFPEVSLKMAIRYLDKYFKPEESGVFIGKHQISKADGGFESHTIHITLTYYEEITVGGVTRDSKRAKYTRIWYNVCNER